jgi:hypothetical protein
MPKAGGFRKREYIIMKKRKQYFFMPPIRGDAEGRGVM